MRQPVFIEPAVIQNMTACREAEVGGHLHPFLTMPQRRASNSQVEVLAKKIDVRNIQEALAGTRARQDRFW